MELSSPTRAAQPVLSNEQEAALRHLPPVAQAAFQYFAASGDGTALDPVILAIINDYIPRMPAQPLAELPGDTRLIEDLGLDSLAITEVVFFTEDLLRIRIANEEIVRVRTLDDLRGFVRSKASACAGS